MHNRWREPKHVETDQERLEREERLAKLDPETRAKYDALANAATKKQQVLPLRK